MDLSRCQVKYTINEIFWGTCLGTCRRLAVVVLSAAIHFKISCLFQYYDEMNTKQNKKGFIKFIIMINQFASFFSFIRLRFFDKNCQVWQRRSISLWQTPKENDYRLLWLWEFGRSVALIRHMLCFDTVHIIYFFSCQG